ncbi:MAG: alpha amylase catalytic region, partial [Bacteroidetes bacterium]|nr:alpha amylase catalytic region [Bacteroidota bacterium]
MAKFTIYQVIPRLFGNYNPTRKHNGTISENGCGKFSSFTPKAFEAIKELGVTHIWYTGIIEHAT